MIKRYSLDRLTMDQGYAYHTLSKLAKELFYTTGEHPGSIQKGSNEDWLKGGNSIAH